MAMSLEEMDRQNKLWAEQQAAGGGYQPAPQAIPRPSMENLQSVMNQLLQSREYVETEAFGTMADRMRSDFQRRGLRGSGLHAQSLSEALGQAAYAGEMGRYGMAGDVYGLGQRDWQLYLQDIQMRHGINLTHEQMEARRSAANQARRGQMMGAFGSLAGTWAGGGFGGGFGGGSGGSGGSGGGGGLFGGSAGAWQDITLDPWR